ncbi:MAG TPA: patatin-like phospholipase family protein [Thermoanaerobaculia bacterium]|nr:patatin-like phospholipase family protein [Thermoanaerobaculia bacterium]
MYPIEVMVAEAELASLLDRAMVSLNALQKEFYFHRPSPELEAQVGLLRGTPHHAPELFGWLESYRARAGGSRPYLILVVAGRLSTASYENAFGSHRAAQGLAVFTLYDRGRFVADAVRFIRYYLVRYAISFIAPSLGTHEETRGCFLDRKEYKPSIQESLLSGGICDQHRRELRAHISPQVHASLELMCKRVAEDLPYAIVMKGGGVKGLALTGALEVLSQYLSFDVFVGTSAGAMTAVLLAAGYTPPELREELYELDFSRFCDSGLFRIASNILRRGALHSGDSMQDWLEERLVARCGIPPPVRLSDLPSRAVVYACSANGVLAFDKLGDRASEPASFAVRCSAAIPFFFASPLMAGVRAFDGGLWQNFPLMRFIADNPQKPVIGLYLKPQFMRKRSLVSDLIESATVGEEPDVIRKYANQIVAIDPFPVRTTDFSISRNEKSFLLAAGRFAAIDFLVKNLPDEAPGSSVLQEAQQQLMSLRASIDRKKL